MTRPSYSEAIAYTVCERVATGESVVDICRDDTMPAQSSVYKWLNEHPDFAERYARARLVQADVIFDQILKIADTPVIGVKTITKSSGVETTEGDMIEHRRLQVDARKWVAAKLSPKKYSDKLETVHTGDPSNPVVQRIERIIVDPTAS